MSRRLASLAVLSLCAMGMLLPGGAAAAAKTAWARYHNPHPGCKPPRFNR
jgi:hypothetical protein